MRNSPPKQGSNLSKRHETHKESSPAPERGLYHFALNLPDVLYKDKADAGRINADLDLALFGSAIAPALGITKRFVGTEPFCAVTRAYNERMKQILPKYGVEVIEIPRIGGISASLVRKAMAEGNLELVSKSCRKQPWNT